MLRLMVIDNFNSRRPCICPNKADAILIIDPDAVLPFSVAAQRLQAITRWYSQLAERIYGIHLVELASRDTPQNGRTGPPGFSRSSAVKNIFNALISKAHDHGARIAWMPCYCNLCAKNTSR